MKAVDHEPTNNSIHLVSSIVASLVEVESSEEHFVVAISDRHAVDKSAMAASVAEWVRSLYFSALNHSIISPLCLL